FDNASYWIERCFQVFQAEFTTNDHGRTFDSNPSFIELVTLSQPFGLGQRQFFVDTGVEQSNDFATNGDRSRNPDDFVNRANNARCDTGFTVTGFAVQEHASPCGNCLTDLSDQ